MQFCLLLFPPAAANREVPASPWTLTCLPLFFLSPRTIKSWPVNHLQLTCLPCSLRCWRGVGSRAALAPFPGHGQDWEPCPRPLLSAWPSKAQLTARRRAGGGPEPRGSPASLLPCCLVPCLLRHGSGLLQGLSTPLSNPDREKKQKDFLIA